MLILHSWRKYFEGPTSCYMAKPTKDLDMTRKDWNCQHSIHRGKVRREMPCLLNPCSKEVLPASEYPTAGTPSRATLLWPPFDWRNRRSLDTREKRDAVVYQQRYALPSPILAGWHSLGCSVYGLLGEFHKRHRLAKWALNGIDVQLERAHKHLIHTQLSRKKEYTFFHPAHCPQIPWVTGTSLEKNVGVYVPFLFLVFLLPNRCDLVCFFGLYICTYVYMYIYICVYIYTHALWGEVLAQYLPS